MTTTTPKPPKPRPRGGILGPGDPRFEDLPDGALACRSCGVAVRQPDPARAADLTVYQRENPALARSMAEKGFPVPSFDVPLTRCDDCTARRAQAEAILAVHPRVRRTHGDVALDRLDAALGALDLLGYRGRHGEAMIDALMDDDAGIHRSMGHLAAIGGASSWSAANPVAGSAARGRWGHVRVELIERARRESRTLYHRQFESPAAVPPPEDGERGCLVCGVGHVRTLASDRSAWGEIIRLDASVLGGSPRQVAGYLCPTDRAALLENGNAIGEVVTDKAVLAHVGYALTPLGRIERAIAKAWVTLPAGTEPNRQPWEHADLARVRRIAERSTYVRALPDRASA